MNEYTYRFIGMDDYIEVRQEIKWLLQRYLSGDAFFMEVVVNEAINNAISHGSSEKEVTIRLRMNAKRLFIRIKDQGRGFKANERMLQTYNDIWKDCGRGLLIMKKYVNLIRYNHQGNDLLLVKELPKTTTDL